MMSLGQKAFLSFSLLSLMACSDNDNKDLIKYLSQVKHRATRKIEPSTEVGLIPEFKYFIENNRRNPFTSLDKKISHKENQKPGLKDYPLSALIFVGTLSQEHRIWALIKQPNEQIVSVHEGEYIGQGYGRIIGINQHSITVEERIKGSLGLMEKHQSILNLYSGQ